MLVTFLGTIWGEAQFLPWFLLYAVLEIPFGAKPVDWRAMLQNWGYWPVWVLGNASIAVLLDTVGRPALQGWANRHGLEIPGSHMHPIVAALAGLLVFDVFYYWFHRVQHTRVLWHQHAIHHSDRAINATTAFRHHFLENLVKYPLVDLPLLFIYVEAVRRTDVSFAETVAVAFVAHLGIFAHANLRIGFGWLSWLLVCPQSHRLHHSAEKRHWGHNYAAYFPLIDVVFGTYMRPAPGEYPETGMAGMAEAMANPLRMSAYPFHAWNAQFRRYRHARYPTTPRISEPATVPATDPAADSDAWPAR